MENVCDVVVLAEENSSVIERDSNAKEVMKPAKIRNFSPDVIVHLVKVELDGDVGSDLTDTKGFIR